MSGGGDAEYIPSFDDAYELDFGSTQNIGDYFNFEDFDFTSLFSDLEFLHPHFLQFYNLLTSSMGFLPTGLYTLTHQYFPRVMQLVRDHRKKSSTPIFYSLTQFAYSLVLFTVYHFSYVLNTFPAVRLGTYDVYAPSIFLMFAIYYGADTYILRVPQKATDVPAVAMRLCFARALNKLGQKLASEPLRYEALEPQRFILPSGANMVDVRFCFQDSLHNHRGPPYDKKTKFSLKVDIDIHTTGMLPAVHKGCRREFINRHLFGSRQLVNQIQLPTVKFWEGPQSSFIYDPTIPWIREREPVEDPRQSSTSTVACE